MSKYETWCRCRLRRVPRTRSLRRIKIIHPLDKTAVFQFAHEATVDDLLQFDLADAGITDLHQTFYLAPSLPGGMGSLFEAAARQQFLVAFFGERGIGDSQPAHNALEHGAFTFRRPGESQPFDQRPQNVFDDLRLALQITFLDRHQMVHDRLFALEKSAKLMKPLAFALRLKTPSRDVASMMPPSSA